MGGGAALQIYPGACCGRRPRPRGSERRRWRRTAGSSRRRSGRRFVGTWTEPSGSNDDVGARRGEGGRLARGRYWRALTASPLDEPIPAREASRASARSHGPPTPKCHFLPAATTGEPRLLLDTPPASLASQDRIPVLAGPDGLEDLPPRRACLPELLFRAPTMTATATVLTIATRTRSSPALSLCLTDGHRRLPLPCVQPSVPHRAFCRETLDGA